MTELIKIEDVAAAKKAQELAYEIWHEHYADILSVEQIDYMLKNQTAEEILNHSSEGYVFYLIRLDEKDIGYTAVSYDEKLDNRALVSKLYIKSEKRGQGVGKAVMSLHSQNAKKLGFDGLYLYVNKKNDALFAYEKLGFKKERAVVTDIGNGFVMDDFIMSLDF